MAEVNKLDSDRGSETNNPEFNAEGKNEKLAIKDAGQALKIARRLHRDDDRRDVERARVLSAFNGAPPWDSCELESLGQNYRFNVSFGTLEGIMGRATAPYTELVSDTQYIANIDGILPENKLIIMREELTETIRQWGKWGKFTSRLIQDLLLNGYNSAIFPSDYDPFPMLIQQKDGFVHELTGNDVSDLEVFVWKRSYLIHELYAYIEDEEVAKAAGWNVKNARLAIENAVPASLYEGDTSGGYGGVWTKMEMAIRGGSLFTSMVGGKQIDTYHVLATECDGGVSHFIVSNGKGVESDDKTEGVELFKRIRRWKSMKDVLVYFDLEPGDGKWHGSRGIGRRAFNTHRAVDKLRCSLLDQAFTSGLTILQAKDQTDQENFTLSVVGPFAVIPAGIDVSATTVPAISATTFQVDALLSSTSEQRLGDIMPNTSSPSRHGTKTATEATISDQRAELINKANLTRFLDPVSAMISIIVKRLLMENSPDPFAQYFQNKLLARGITPEDFKQVRGAQSTGRIDDVLGDDTANMQLLLQVYRGDPDIDQKELKRRHLASIVGPKDLIGLLIEGNDQTIEIEAAREQIGENEDMVMGANIPVSARDNHEVHATTAINWLKMQMKMSIQGKGGAPIQALDLVAQHINEHLNFMMKDPSKKPFVDRAKNELAQIGGLLDKMQQVAQQAANQARGQAPMGPQPVMQ